MNSQKKLCYVNNWLVDIASGSLIHRETGEKNRLGEYQFKLLEILINNAGNVLTREELTELVWQKRIVGNNSLPNAIHALRLALEDNGKNQKIIKTIPKRGYLLEKTFCSFEPINAPARTINHTQYDVPAWQENIPQSGETLRPRMIFRKWSAYLLVLFCAVSLGISAYLYLTSTKTTNKSRFEVRQLNNLTFQNIDMFQVIKGTRLSEKPDDPDKLEQRLLPALQELDTRLTETQSNLKIYYQASDAVLNYVFAIESPCRRQELSMNIYHWRINTERLNTLILNETKRKLNETINCFN